MRTLDQVADLVAEVLMPDAPGLVLAEAERVATVLLEGHAVVELPAPGLEDVSGAMWQAPDGLELVRADGGMLWIDDDILTPEQAIDLAKALLAAARVAQSSMGARR